MEGEVHVGAREGDRAPAFMILAILAPLLLGVAALFKIADPSPPESP